MTQSWHADSSTRPEKLAYLIVSDDLHVMKMNYRQEKKPDLPISVITWRSDYEKFTACLTPMGIPVLKAESKTVRAPPPSARRRRSVKPLLAAKRSRTSDAHYYYCRHRAGARETPPEASLETGSFINKRIDKANAMASSVET